MQFHALYVDDSVVCRGMAELMFYEHKITTVPDVWVFRKMITEDLKQQTLDVILFDMNLGSRPLDGVDLAKETIEKYERAIRQGGVYVLPTMAFVSDEPISNQAHASNNMVDGKIDIWIPKKEFNQKYANHWIKEFLSHKITRDQTIKYKQGNKTNPIDRVI